MRSKNWCCKLSWPLIRKDLTRFWPVWGTYFAIWFLILPVPFFTDIDHYSVRPELVGAIHRHVVNCGAEPALILSAGAGLVASFAVWSYLFQGRSASLFHSLPVTRETLFLSHWTAGLSFLILPNALLAGISYLFQMAMGWFDPTILLTWFAVVSLQCLLFYSIGTLCAMFTGSLPAMPVLYILVNFAAVIIESLMNGFSTMLYYGVNDLDLRFTALSPAWKLLEDTAYLYRDVKISSMGFNWANLKFYHPDYLRTLCIYGAVAVVLTVCALLLYRKRTTECAGDVIAVPWLKPIAKYVFSIGCALVLGYILLEIVFSGENHPLVIIPCLIVGAAVGYLAAEMLLKKSFRVFSLRRMAGLLCLAVALGGWVLAVEADLFGVERRVPELEDVTSVYIRADYQLELDHPQDIAPVLELHRTILREGEPGYEPRLIYTRIEYELKDGSTMERSYRVPYDAARLADPTTAAGQLKSIMDDPWRLMENLLPPSDAFVRSMQLHLDTPLLDLKYPEAGFTYNDCLISTEHHAALRQALETDILMGHLGGWLRESDDKYYDSEQHMWIDFEYDRRDADGNTYSEWRSVHLTTLDLAPATRQALYDLGYLTEVPHA